MKKLQKIRLCFFTLILPKTEKNQINFEQLFLKTIKIDDFTNKNPDIENYLDEFKQMTLGYIRNENLLLFEKIIQGYCNLIKSCLEIEFYETFQNTIFFLQINTIIVILLANFHEIIKAACKSDNDNFISYIEIELF